MSDTLNLANSIWPNGMKVDSDGYAVFYPLGTNKVNVPTSSTEWPKGNKFISPFVYQDDKLVGFVDTKALTVSDNTTIYLPYEHIEAQFSSIEKGKLQIHAPKATTKKASWKNSGVEDISETQFKYKGCKTLNDVKTIDSSYINNDIIDGVWSEPLWDLEQSGNHMFYYSTNLASFSSDLPSLTNGSDMFEFCTKLTSFNSDLSSLTNGSDMFYYCINLASFSSDLPSLTNGERMFDYCTNLASFSSDLSSLTNGFGMFFECRNLESFSSDLPSLTNGDNMFHSCTNLESFSSDLSSLTDGDYMFYETSLASFNADLSSLTDGEGMFSDCFNLTTFSSNLSSLTNGVYMFSGCSQLTSFNGDLSSLTDGSHMFAYSNLASFSSDLSSLTNGSQMFADCILDAPSVKNIIDTINTYSGSLTIGMGCNVYTTADKDLFAQEIGYSDMTSLLAALKAKGWDVYAQYNGRPTTTYGLRRPSEDTLPVFVKLEEADYEVKEIDGKVIKINQATHTNEDGSMLYRLTWFHETTGSTDGYTQFNSLEEAIETLNIKQIERN